MSQKKAKQKRREMMLSGPMMTIEYECEDSNHIPTEMGQMTVPVRFILDAMCLCDFIKPMIAGYNKVQVTFSKGED